MENLSNRYSKDALMGLAKAVLDRIGVASTVALQEAIISMFRVYPLPSPDPVPADPDDDKAADAYLAGYGDCFSHQGKADILAAFHHGAAWARSTSHTLDIPGNGAAFYVHAVGHGVNEIGSRDAIEYLRHAIQIHSQPGKADPFTEFQRHVEEAYAMPSDGPCETAESELDHYKRRAEDAIELKAQLENAERVARFWRLMARSRGEAMAELGRLVDELTGQR